MALGETFHKTCYRGSLGNFLQKIKKNTSWCWTPSSFSKVQNTSHTLVGSLSKGKVCKINCSVTTNEDFFYRFLDEDNTQWLIILNGLWKKDSDNVKFWNKLLGGESEMWKWVMNGLWPLKVFNDRQLSQVLHSFSFQFVFGGHFHTSAQIKSRNNFQFTLLGT